MKKLFKKVFSVKTSPFLIELYFTTIYCGLYSQKYLFIVPVLYIATYFYCLGVAATVINFHYNKVINPGSTIKLYMSVE